MTPVAIALTAAALIALGAIAVIDLRTMRAPNRYVAGALTLALAAGLTLSGGALLDATLGAVLAFVLLLIVALAGRGKMGLGDVKYGAACGGVLGIQSVVPMLLVTFVGGALVATALLIWGLRSKQDVLAFTPFLFAGTLIALAWSGAVVTAA